MSIVSVDLTSTKSKCKTTGKSKSLFLAFLGQVTLVKEVLISIGHLSG